MEIEIIKRASFAILKDRIIEEILETEKSKIAPSRCPAINKAYNRGVFILSPKDYYFKKNYFVVNEYKSLLGHKILDPGIIGTPDSNHIYARIDLGFSFENIPCDILATPILASYFNNQFEIPAVIYNKGYTGPILAPISCELNKKLIKGTPILQLNPLVEEFSFKIINKFIDHAGFEGLFNFENELNLTFIKTFNSNKLDNFIGN